MHPTSYATFLIKEKEEGGVRKEKREGHYLTSGSSSNKIRRYFSTLQVISTNVTIRPEQVLLGLIELVTVNGRPFATLNNSGLIHAFGPVLKAGNLTVNSHNIIQFIQERCNQIQPQIKLTIDLYV